MPTVQCLLLSTMAELSEYDMQLFVSYYQNLMWSPKQPSHCNETLCNDAWIETRKTYITMEECKKDDCLVAGHEKEDESYRFKSLLSDLSSTNIFVMNILLSILSLFN